MMSNSSQKITGHYSQVAWAAHSIESRNTWAEEKKRPLDSKDAENKAEVEQFLTERMTQRRCSSKTLSVSESRVRLYKVWKCNKGFYFLT